MPLDDIGCLHDLVFLIPDLISLKSSRLFCEGMKETIENKK